MGHLLCSISALGITDEVEQLGLKGNKKKKGKKLDEDYVVGLSVKWGISGPMLKHHLADSSTTLGERCPQSRSSDSSNSESQGSTQAPIAHQGATATCSLKYETYVKILR